MAKAPTKTAARLAPVASAHGLFKPDGTPNSILDIAGEHTGDTRRPKESP